VAEVTPAASRSEGRTVATGKLGEIAKEAVQNVSALVKKYTGEDITKYDIHVQFVGAYEGVEGDSASVSIAAAVISALEEAEVDQSIALTGSLSVRGQVLPVGGVTAKIEAAAEAGIRKVLIPEANMQDVLLESRYRGKIEVVPVATLQDVLDNILVPGSSKESLLEKLALARFLPGKFPGSPSAA
jgi:Lon-like ATP-dependent protease